MMCNRDNLPIHPAYVEDLGAVPDGFRIYKTDPGEPYDDEESTPWQLDGWAIIAGRFAVTATCWNFVTWPDALGALAEFAEAVKR